MVPLAEQAAKASPWKWNNKEILEESEKSLGNTLKYTLESIREEQLTITQFAENLADISGQSVPPREHLEQSQEPDTQIADIKAIMQNYMTNH